MRRRFTLIALPLLVIVGATYALGYSSLFTVSSIEITGSKSEITFVDYADAYEAGFEDMQRRVPSTQRLVLLTGWKVTKSLEEIIRDVAADLAK